MSLFVPPLYHWSPATCRKGIIRHGLKPTTATAVWHRPLRPGEKVGHHHEDLEAEQLYAICLGTTPATAWAYSGAWSAERGVSEVWDLWEVTLHEDDEVHVRPRYGYIMEEIRVINPIPKARVWHVGSRTVGNRRFSHAP